MLPKEVVIAYRKEFISDFGGIVDTSRPPWIRTRNTIPETTTWTTLQITALVQNKLSDGTCTYKQHHKR